MSDREPDSLTLVDVEEARKRLAGILPRTPLIRLEDGGTGELYLKLENLQPVRS
ncbi:MAG TPA: pyridoxal-5'-phosphate-dependent protein subunit beta, partial [Chloroflexi bacterium]|nr:pyridoxal-5'-phosphate-dependent protein subunit beta [Chloroflexota bacterium]